jgi:hypothetical protein
MLVMTPHKITSVPDLDWTDHAREEIEINPDLVERSVVAYQFGDMLIAGLCYPVLCGPPWFWFAATKSLRLRPILRLAFLLPSNCYTAVKNGWPAGDKFAQFFGFQPQNKLDEYTVYWRA